MASQESICIDINGTEVFKVLPQNTYPDKAIEELFYLNNFNITRIVEGNGFRTFFYSTIGSDSQKQLNIFYRNFKFDLERPRFININLGTNIKNPFELQLEDVDAVQTRILGIYSFDKDDTSKDLIFVNCPVKQRNYKGNPSIRINIELIKKARIESSASWENKAGDHFFAFKAPYFHQIISEGKKSKDPEEKKFLESSNFLNQISQTKNLRRKGPSPRVRGYEVLTNSENSASFYIAQFGKTDVFKVGYSQNVEDRVKQFNQYIPYEELNLDTWSILMKLFFKTKKEAYDFEQKILEHKVLKNNRATGERFKCSYQLLSSLVKSEFSQFAEY